MNNMQASIYAPEFPNDASWLNVDHPLSIRELRGKIVLLDFWTFCCINCMHIIPELKKLEEQFPETLVVIGVHAAKYRAEEDLENVRQAVLRYDIEHPVVNDPLHLIWDSYSVNAWPTLALIDPDGRLVGEHPGEFVAEDFARTISVLEKEFDKVGKLRRGGLDTSPERDKESERFLKFPGKVLADAERNRLFIADSSNHRIIETDLRGSLKRIIGSGQQGMNDGSFDQARFNNPQGMALHEDSLYVADTDNHAIRKLHLGKEIVERVAGTGEQARLSRRSGPSLATALSSPWDLAIGKNRLFIANAGNHQIWSFDLNGNELHRFAGTGREALSDGTLEHCALAQTSGLVFYNDDLYFVDSETSSVRVARIDDDRVETLIGQGLFDFGDIDGNSDMVRLQHCLGIDHRNGMLYIADTYNNKIKILDPNTRDCITFAGDGDAGHYDGERLDSRFWEPGGLSIGSNYLYVADTNNHAVRSIELESGLVSTMIVG